MNIYDYDTFIELSKTSGSEFKIFPGDPICEWNEYSDLNEQLNQGGDLEGQKLGETEVQDWLFSFNLSKNDFPNYPAITDNIQGELLLSDFTAAMINEYIASSWKLIKSKKPYTEIFSKDEDSLRKKLRGIFFNKRLLRHYKEEKEQLREYIKELDDAIKSGYFSNSIKESANDIILSNSTKIDWKPLKSLGLGLKTFFSFGKSWSRAVSWIVMNIALDKNHVQWLTPYMYTAATGVSGTNPPVTSAFYKFTESGVTPNATIPNLKKSSKTINYVAKKVIQSSEQLPKRNIGAWSDTLNNTFLFSIFQQLLIIGSCAYTLDLIGDTNIMSNLNAAETERSPESLNTGDLTGASVFGSDNTKVKIEYGDELFIKLVNGFENYDSFYKDPNYSSKNPANALRALRNSLRLFALQETKLGLNKSSQRTDAHVNKHIYGSPVSHANITAVEISKDVLDAVLNKLKV